MKAIFLRVVEDGNKALALREAIQSPRSAGTVARFEVDTAEFGLVPASPLAYWLAPGIRRLYGTMDSIESEGRLVRTTNNVGENDRFVRLWWEVCAADRAAWPSWSKGVTSLFYSDLQHVIAWDAKRATYHGFTGTGGRPLARPASVDLFFKPGITWPLRARRFSPSALPAGSIFSVRSFMIFDPCGATRRLVLLAICASSVVDSLMKVMMGRMGYPEFIVTAVQRLPFPCLEKLDAQLATALAGYARHAWSLKRTLDTRAESSHAFHLPALLQVDSDMLSGRADASNQHAANTEAELARLQAEIDDRCFELYGIDGADREQIERGLGGSTAEDDAADAEDDETSEAEELDTAQLVASLLSWSVGVAFGRFDLRLATSERPAPREPEPFDPLPACSPGMLTGEDGLPLEEPPAGYTIDFPSDGILVDDAGAPRDLVAAARQVFEHVFDDSAARWEESAEILGDRDGTLRRWFARDFFGLHLKHYSKSRRKAPIYWPLSTASGSYTVWLYYHRLTADTLFQVVVEYLDPKIRKVQEERLQVDGRLGRAEGREAAKLAKQSGELAELEQELKEMKAELLRVAELPYKPNLNDGVQITSAPLWKLFRLPVWRKVLETTWKKLEKGEYDWAHLAYHIWPERVRGKCKTDRSLAIAHGLEDLCDGEVAPKKQRRSKGGS